MFGIGSMELVVILLVALIVLGPKSIPQIAKTIGKVMGEVRRVSTDFQRAMNVEVAAEEREAAEKRAQAQQAERQAEPAPDTGAAQPAEQPAKDVAAHPDASTSPAGDYFNGETRPAEPDIEPDSPLARAVAKAAAEAATTGATAPSPSEPQS